MKAAVLPAYDTPIETRDDIEIAPPGPGEVRIKVVASGVCHSDLSVQNGTIPRPTPIVLGHEFSGEVVEVVPFGAQGGEGGHFDAQGCAGGSSGMNVAGPTDRPAAGVLVPAGTWHTVLAMDDDAILFETKAGPFDPAAPKEPAPWAPAEGTAEAGAYFARLRALVGG